MAKLEVIATGLDGSGLKLVRWSDIGASEAGTPFVCGAYQDKSVQFVSTGGSGITIQGSLDTDPATSDWETLNDPQGVALAAVTSDKLENILEHCYQIRPLALAGVSGATVWLLLGSSR